MRENFKPRWKRGSELSNTVVDEKIVYAIKYDYMKGISNRELKERYNIKTSTLEAILHERNWEQVKVEGYSYKKDTRMANKLNADIVREIKILLKEGVMKKVRIAEKFGVSRNTILNIQKGKTWKEVKI